MLYSNEIYFGYKNWSVELSLIIHVSKILTLHKIEEQYLIKDRMVTARGIPILCLIFIHFSAGKQVIELIQFYQSINWTHYIRNISYITSRQLYFAAYPIEQGYLTKHSHAVTGKVTILDEKRIMVSDMTYDGKLCLTNYNILYFR